MLAQFDSQIQNRLKLSPSEMAEFCQRWLCQRWQITELALFGSILRDDFRPDSDIDLLLSFSPQAQQGLLTLAKIKHELEDRIRRRANVTLNQLLSMSLSFVSILKLLLQENQWQLNNLPLQKP